MLERTSACLDSGVRLSLCGAKRQANRSRRLLHQHFWRHGAGDIHLPTCMLPSSLPPPTSSNAQPSPSEPVFLDFLYPAQTLAFMSRASTSHLDRIRDRRVAHTAAAVNGHRGYSSMTPSSNHKPEPASTGVAVASPNPHTASSHDYSEPRYTYTPSLTGTTISATRSGRLTLDKPSDELKTLLLEHPDGPDPELDVEQRAWDVYVSMLDFDQQIELVQDFLLWLAKRPQRSTSPRIIAVFKRLSEKGRIKIAPIYSAAVAAHLALGHHDQALHLGKVARILFADSLAGTDILLAHAISNDQWDLAVELCSSFGRKTQRELFVKAATMADFDHHFFALVKYYKELARDPTKSAYSTTSSILAIIEGVWDARVHHFVHAKEFQSYTPAYFQPNRLRSFFLRMHSHQLPSNQIYNALLCHALRVWTPGSPEVFTELITYVYKEYHRSAAFKPSRELIKRLVQFWRDYTLAFRGDPRRSVFIKLDELTQDLKKYNVLNDSETHFIVLTIMDAMARLGNVDEVERYAQWYKSYFPEGLADASRLWPLVYVHAMRAEPNRARDRLNTIKRDFGVDPDVRCWNVVIHAYEEANDVKGAIDTLDDMLKSGVNPTEYSFGPLCNLFARRGDVASTVTLINAAKAHDIIPGMTMLNSLIIAHVNNDDLESALRALKDTVKAVKDGEATGSLTMCFNTVMVAYALARDIDSTMELYRRMKAEKIALDSKTYGALVQALSVFRRTDYANKIVTTIMRDNNVRPEGFHYAVVMIGYVNQGMYRQALGVAQDMARARVRPTESTRAIFLKAKTLLDHVMTGGDVIYDDGEGRLPLQNAIKAYERWYRPSDMAQPGTNQPTQAPQLRKLQNTVGMDVDFLVFIHGKRRSFEAAKAIAETYMENLRTQRGDPGAKPPIGLATALMAVHLREGNYELVDAYWALIVDQADFVRRYHQETKLANNGTPAPNPRKLPRISPSHRFMLNVPMRYFLASQFSQNPLGAPSRMTNLFYELMSDGYRFDMRTWNALIVALCRASPPRVLLAWKLMERFMIRNFPGWIPTRMGIVSNNTIKPLPSAKASGVQYLRNNFNTRYRAQGDLVPQYRTMVYLGSALLELRTLEAEGTLRGGLKSSGLTPEQQEEVLEQVGTMRQVKAAAPNTWQAVNSMPKVNDRLQKKLINGEETEEGQS